MRPYRSCDKRNGFSTALASGDSALRKWLPDAAGRRFDGIVAGPILDDVVRSVRLAPRDANTVDGLRLRQIEQDPLRMKAVAFAGEMLGEIRIALPESVEVTVGEAGEPGVFRTVVARETATGKRISVGGAKAFRGNGSAREIAFARGITPSPPPIPVPGFDRQLGIFAVRQRLPAGGQRCLQRGWKQIFVDGLGGNAVDAGAQSFTGNEVVCRVRGVNRDGLPRGENGEHRHDCKSGGRNFHANASRCQEERY